MNKSKLLVGLLLVFLSFNFIACEDEPVDPFLLIPETPEAACNTPAGLSASDFIGTSVNVSWTASEGTAWEVQYGLHGFAPGSGTSIASNTTNIVVNGLNTSNDYDFYVRTNCGLGLYSGWIGPVAVGSTISTCANPTNFSALRSIVTDTQINLTWNANGDESSWQVQYGPTGFAIGGGTIVSSATTTKAITGLLANQGYDFYVRSNCSVTNNSNWVGPVHVNPVGSISDAFYAKVDGVEFVDTDIEVIASTFNGGPSVIINAADAADNEIEINIKDDAVVGVAYLMTLAPTDKFSIAYWKPFPTALTVSPNATLTITQRTATRISGTFSFDATDPTFTITHVTQGTFDVALP